jgi:hypothetical protein
MQPSIQMQTSSASATGVSPWVSLDFPKKFLESPIGSLEIAPKYQLVAVAP